MGWSLKRFSDERNNKRQPNYPCIPPSVEEVVCIHTSCDTLTISTSMHIPHIIHVNSKQDAIAPEEIIMLIVGVGVIQKDCLRGKDNRKIKN